MPVDPKDELFGVWSKQSVGKCFEQEPLVVNVHLSVFIFGNLDVVRSNRVFGKRFARAHVPDAQVHVVAPREKMPAVAREADLAPAAPVPEAVVKMAPKPSRD